MVSIKILLVDNSFKVRESLRELLCTSSNTKVIGECGDGIEVIPFLKHNKIDVVFIDLLIKSNSGVEVIKKIKEFSSDIKVIVFSMNDSQNVRDKVLLSGADSFISKIDFTKQEIVSELNRVISRNEVADK